MKMIVAVSVAVLAGFAFFASVPALAAHVDVSIGLPGVYVQPMYQQPEVVYAQPRRMNGGRATSAPLAREPGSAQVAPGQRPP